MTSPDRMGSDRKRPGHFWKRLFDSVGGIDSSRRLATGIALGMLIGLVPKESLFPYLVGVALILSPANLLTGIVSALLFGMLAKTAVLMSVFDQLGIFMLSRDWLIDRIGAVYQYPLLSWLRLENSAVAGSILVGLVTVFPVYVVSERWFKAQGIGLLEKTMQLQFFRRFLGVRKRTFPGQQSESLI